MYTKIRQCIMRNNQSPTFNINFTVGGQRLTYSVISYFLCPVHTFFVDQGIMKLLGTNVYNYKMCRAQHPDL
jgi:hypothetical protein